MAPAFVLGNVRGGLRAHRSTKRVFIYGV